MNQTRHQLDIISKILGASDAEVSDCQYMYQLISQYGIYPFYEIEQSNGECNFTTDGIMQAPMEFANFCCFLSKWEVDTAIEIGVYRGRSSYIICALLYRNNPNMTYDMVDIYDHLDEFDQFAELLPPLRKHIPCTSDDFCGKEYDFVFIDADHSYDGSMKDYLNVGRYAKKILCFHDVYDHISDAQNGGTVRLWKEIQAISLHNVKIVFSQFPDMMMGIGVCINMQEERIGSREDIENIRKEVKELLTQITQYKYVYIYGTRYASQRLMNNLEHHKVNIQGYVVSDQFLSENSSEIDGKVVNALSAIPIFSEKTMLLIPLRHDLAVKIEDDLVVAGINKSQIYIIDRNMISFLDN